MTNTKCPVCEKTFPTQIAMRQHFNEAHRNAGSAQAVGGDGPDSMVAAGAVPKRRCGNCQFFGRANGITVCRHSPGTPGMATGAGGAVVPVTFYPPVWPNDWCGQYIAGEWEAIEPAT